MVLVLGIRSVGVLLAGCLPCCCFGTLASFCVPCCACFLFFLGRKICWSFLDAFVGFFEKQGRLLEGSYVSIMIRSSFAASSASPPNIMMSSLLSSNGSVFPLRVTVFLSTSPHGPALIFSSRLTTVP